MPSKVLRFADYTVMPWKNGLGVTREIARYPPEGDFEWRLSMATVGQWAEFSAFAGVTRTLAVVEGGPLELVVDGTTQMLERGGPATTFSGTAPAGAAAAHRATDLNLMARAGWTGSIEPLDGTAVRPADHTFVIDLATLDTTVLDGPVTSGAGYLVRISRAATARR